MVRAAVSLDVAPRVAGEGLLLSNAAVEATLGWMQQQVGTAAVECGSGGLARMGQQVETAVVAETVGALGWVGVISMRELCRLDCVRKQDSVAMQLNEAVVMRSGGRICAP